MLKLNQLREDYNEKLQEYQMYYTESITAIDRKVKNTMKKKCDESTPLLQYYLGEIRAIEKTINFLENTVKSFEESIEYMSETSKDKEYIKNHYGSQRVFDDSYMKEVGALEAYKNLLSYLKS